MTMNSSFLIAAIAQAGLATLRVGFTFAVIVFLLAGVFIFRRRHQLFDRDPNVENDVPVARHNRVEEVVFVWSGLMWFCSAFFSKSGVHDVNEQLLW